MRLLGLTDLITHT